LESFFLPSLIFVVFTLLSAVGAYLIFAHHRGRAAGVVAAVLIVVFFVSLFFGLYLLMPEGSTP
jgi:hypothetical protein